MGTPAPSRAFLLAPALFLFSLSSFAADVLTHHNDVTRRGAVLNETELTRAKVQHEFGRLFSYSVDGQVYAQPLFVSGLKLDDGTVRDVLYVATMRNQVYAFDASKNADRQHPLLWTQDLGQPFPFDRIPKDAGAELGAYNIMPYIGITSTPVIDRARNRLYAVAKVADPHYPCAPNDGSEATDDCPVYYRLFSFDLKTGDSKMQEITLPPPLDGKSGTSPIAPADAARRELQRAALLESDGRIYVAFGSHQDAPPWQGWIFSFDAGTLQPIAQFCTTPGGTEGGIWQAGNGLAADSNGNVYAATGNGTFVPGAQFGSNLIRLTPGLKIASWFAPKNVSDLNMYDIDLGSSGPVLLPDDNVLIASKEGRIYLLRGADPTQRPSTGQGYGFQPRVQIFQAARSWRPRFLALFAWIYPPIFNIGYHHIHGSPVYWRSDKSGPHIYVWPEEDNLRSYHYETALGKFDTHPVKGMMGNKGMPGGFLSISANQGKEGILWASIPCEDDAWVKIVRGCLYAFDADNIKAGPLWSSIGNDRSDYFDFAKYVPPTIANGRVYMATFSGRVNVYGVRPAAPGAKPVTVTTDSRKRGHLKGANGHTMKH